MTTSSMTTHTLLMATRNTGKRLEYEMMLAKTLPTHWSFATLHEIAPHMPDVIEDRDTCVENAIKKALESAQYTKLCAMSEDSGLMVDALHGAPGVYSSRFAGEDADDEANNTLLLQRLEHTPKAQRTARYVAIICLAIPHTVSGTAMLDALGLQREHICAGAPQDPGIPGTVEDHVILWFRGKVEGMILRQRRGQHGFGYDPLFLIEEWGKTFAQVNATQKNTISHRARALASLSQAFS